MEISFVDENYFVKEGKWYFLSDDLQWDTTRTSGETDVRFRLKLKITYLELTYPSQRPDSPSLSPYFLLSKPITESSSYILIIYLLSCPRVTLN